MSDDTSWLVEGAQVAEHRPGRKTTLNTIQRFTARDVVLADGMRYRRSTLSVGDGTPYSTYLRPPTAPEVARALAAQRHSENVNTAEHMLKKWRNGDDGARFELIQFLQSIETDGRSDGEA